jgi:hypothetical protein
MSKKVQVLSTDSNEVLFECDLSNESQAYEYAAHMEELGIDVEVVSPNVIDTLTTALGLKKDEEDAFRHSVYEEIHDHEGQEETESVDTDSCCTKYIEVSKTIQ